MAAVAIREGKAAAVSDEIRLKKFTPIINQANPIGFIGTMPQSATDRPGNSNAHKSATPPSTVHGSVKRSPGLPARPKRKLAVEQETTKTAQNPSHRREESFRSSSRPVKPNTATAKSIEINAPTGGAAKANG